MTRYLLYYTGGARCCPSTVVVYGTIGISMRTNRNGNDACTTSTPSSIGDACNTNDTSNTKKYEELLLRESIKQHYCLFS